MLNIVQTNPLNNLTAQISDRRIKHRQSHLGVHIREIKEPGVAYRKPTS